MRKKFIFVCFLILFSGSSLFAQVGNPSGVETEKNIKILQSIFNDQNTKPSNTQLYEALRAVINLTQIGTTDAIPELGKLLSVEELNTVVRTALINIGGGGIDVLRDSLSSLEGKNLAGVIESLGAIRDQKSVAQLINLIDNKNELVSQAAVLALGKIATPDATKKLVAILSADNKKQLHATTVNALLFAVERLQSITPTKTNDIRKLLNELRKHKEFPATWSAATQTYLLLGGEDDLSLFVELLKSSDSLSFQVARNVALKSELPRVDNLIIDYLTQSTTPANKQLLLIDTLGARKSQKAIPVLVKFASSSDMTIRIAAIKALGKIGGMGGFDTIFAAVNSTDQDVATVAKASLAKLQGKEFNTSIINSLNSTNKIFRLTALSVIEERRIAAAIEKVKLLFNDSDVEIRIAAYQAFSQIIVATPADLELLLSLLPKINSKSDDEKTGLHSALITICRKVAARDESVAVIDKLKNNNDTKTKQFLIDLLYYIGNEKAAKVISDFARSEDNDVVDHATMVLGRWSTPEVAPYLIDLAANHSLEKYRVRTLSGYLRVIRQFGLPLEKKFDMIQKAESIAKRDADKKRIAEIKDRIQSQLKARPIFDGVTFEGWEGNMSYFRIQDGAIVAGSLEKRIPRNEFLCTKKEYGDFALYLEVKVLGNGANAGVQFRSKRLTLDKRRPNEVSGYQADMTETAKFWGSLYDEARRGRFLAEADLEEVKKIFRPNDWNELKIVCKNNNIKLYVNGKMTVDYTEVDETLIKSGIIGLQIHAGNPSEAWYRNIRIESEE
ncbi:MAG: DUF1080 domain-containing protein [Planctomycetaceae bacterium]|jgi:HEAT repeat protein|nr:DUF1080 domain-containing protein [Planctomycetaceae bacterium]